MIFIPGKIISLITFPGVIVHEIAHKFFCDLLNIPVYEASYLPFKKSSGYIKHENIVSVTKALIVTLGPLIINSILCMFLTFSASIPLFILEATLVNPLFYIIFWFGISIGMHALPSDIDIDSFIESVKGSKGQGIIYYISLPFCYFFRIINALRVIWADLIFAIALTWVLPLVFKLVI